MMTRSTSYLQPCPLPVCDFFAHRFVLVAYIVTALKYTPSSAAGAGTVGPLVYGAVALYEAAAGAPDARDPPPWQAHPLSKVLLAHPGAAAPLLEALERLLAGVGANPGSAGLAPTRGEGFTNDYAELLRRTAPFLSFALLEPDPAGAHKY